MCINLIFNLIIIVNLFWLKKNNKLSFGSSVFTIVHSSKNDDGFEHPHLLIVFVVVAALWFEVDQGVQLLSTIAKKAFEIANKFVHVSFAGRLMYDVLVVIISKATAQLFVVHFWFVLAHTPPAGHLVRVREFEFPVVTRPGNECLTSAIGQQLQQELPQLYGAAAGETRASVWRITGDERGSL